MNESSEVCTLTSEAAARLCRELLTTNTPPPSGSSLYLRKDAPPFKTLESQTVPYRRRMWSSKTVKAWCRQFQPPRIRRALACLERLETLEKTHSESWLEDVRTVGQVLAEILAVGDES